MRHKSYKRLKRFLTAQIAILTTLAICTAMYIGVVWLDIPGVSTLRNIWIETAMTTFTHQWLATSIFPEWLINEVIESAEMPEDIPVEVPLSDSTEKIKKVEDPLNQKNLIEGEKDSHGNTIVVNDIEQGIVIVQIKGSTPIGSYTARLVLIDDSARVFVGTTNKKGSYGQVICDLMDNYNVVCGINASGFEDPDGHGKGGVINGLCYSEGSPWGRLNPQYSSIVLTTENKLLVGDIPDWDEYHVRDGAQFFPALISNGNILVGNTSAQQPRTCVGQREDGVFMFLVIDGRSISSVGATYLQCANLLKDYGAVNAAACDGGSSSILAYKGKIMNIPSTPMKSTGRYLPNAFLVRSKNEKVTKNN